MKNRATPLIILLMMALPLRLFGEGTQNLADFKAVYVQETAKIQTNNAALAEAANAYLKALDALASKFKKAGDFPRTKAVLDERKRFETVRSIPDVPPAEIPAEMAAAQADYRSFATDLAVGRNERLIKLTQRYVKALRKHTAMLLEQNRMEEAKEVNEEMEKAMTLEQTLKEALSRKTDVGPAETKQAPPPPPLRTVFVEPISLYGGTAAGLATDGKGNLYIAENRQNGPRVTKVDPEGRRQAFIPAGLLGGVTALAFDADGNLYVADGGANGNAGTRPNDKIWKVLPSGNASVFIPAVKNPTGLAFDSKGNLYVASYADNAVYKYSKKGVFLKIIASDFGALPYGLAADRNDNLYVACYGHAYGKTIYKISRDGQVSPFYTADFPDPHSLAFDKRGNLWASYYNGFKLVKITPNGEATIMPGGWTADDAANGIAFDNEGSLFVAVNGGRTTANSAVLKIINAVR